MRDNEFFAKKIVSEMKKYAFKPNMVKHNLLVDALEDCYESNTDIAETIVESVNNLGEEWQLVVFTYTGFCPCCLKFDIEKSLSFEEIAKAMQYDSWERAREIYKSALEEIALDFLYDYFADFVYNGKCNK